MPEIEMFNYENDQSKAQLLEALCHSQTGAWEAAKRVCAQKDHIVHLVFRKLSEKDSPHLLLHFFSPHSRIAPYFFYLPWKWEAELHTYENCKYDLVKKRMLQIQKIREQEAKIKGSQKGHHSSHPQNSRYLTLKDSIKNNKSQQISSISPLKFPWVPQRNKDSRNKWHKSGRGKQSRARCDISKYAIDFALGLGLVTAGLILGWTVGCEVKFNLKMATLKMHFRESGKQKGERGERKIQSKKMPVMEKLKMFVVQEPVVAASCLIAGVGLFLPAVVRPILDSFESSKQVPQPALSDVVAGMTGKKQG
ncbi:fiber fb11 [Olea europaea subsp. europaea]|uniref:Fiber fb11 n=2 Tax=Olea europaea subsp. europaea TaxID=158383 RepID=A0A8S0QD41_OLEEU|nr:fiber fb11 [Olea europaea subsp. europaea]